MSQSAAAARQAPPRLGGDFETPKGELGALPKYGAGGLLKALSRRRFAAIVSRHNGDKYVNDFAWWDHLVTMVFAQLGGLLSLREVEAVWNAQARHHYHLGSGPVCRSTLSDANRRQPIAVFAEAFAALSEWAGDSLPRQGKQVLRLIATRSGTLRLGRVTKQQPAWCSWHHPRVIDIGLVEDIDSAGLDRLSRRPTTTSLTVAAVISRWTGRSASGS